MVTAIIQNIQRDVERIIVWVNFDGKEERFIFDESTTKLEMKAQIKSRLDYLNSIEAKIESLKDLVGTEVK